MRNVGVIVGRNIKRYTRDIGALLFSLLSVFIVIALYVFFLTDMQIDGLKSSVGNIAGADAVVLTWLIGGLVCIPAISVPLQILSFCVDDLVDGIQDDLYVTPASRPAIMIGYVASACVVSFAVSLLTLAGGEVFLIAKGLPALTLGQIVQTAGVLALTVFAFSSFFFCIVTLIKSRSGVVVMGSMLNTLLGFFIGLFMPIGALSGGVATVIKVFPVLQAASLTRQVFMRDALTQMSASIPGSVIDEIKEMYGVTVTIGGHTMQFSDIIIVLGLFGLAACGIAVLLVRCAKRK